MEINKQIRTMNWKETRPTLINKKSNWNICVKHIHPDINQSSNWNICAKHIHWDHQTICRKYQVHRSIQIIEKIFLAFFIYGNSDASNLFGCEIRIPSLVISSQQFSIVFVRPWFGCCRSNLGEEDLTRSVCKALVQHDHVTRSEKSTWIPF